MDSRDIALYTIFAGLQVIGAVLGALSGVGPNLLPSIGQNDARTVNRT